MDNNLNKHIDAKVKQSFDGFQKKAPLHIWENVSEQLDSNQTLDNQIDEKVQDIYQNEIKAVAPGLVWGAIEAELDVDANLDAIVDEKIKGSFETNPVKKAPTSLWSSISSDLDTKVPPLDVLLDDKIKESFLEQEEIRTPNKVWFAINRQLNIDKTWVNISKALDANPIVSDWRKRMLQFMTVAVLLLFFVRTCDYNPYPIKTPTIVVNEIIASSQKTSNDKTEQLNTKKSLTVNKQNKKEEVILKSNTVVERVQTDKFPVFSENSKKELKTAVTHSTKPTLKEEKEDNLASHAIDIAEKVKFIDNKIKSREVVISKNNSSEPILSNSSEKENKEEVNRIENSNSLTKEKGTNQLNWAILEIIQVGELPSSLTTEPIQLVDEMMLAKKKKKNSIEGKLEAGAFIVVNSTMLLNNETREGFDANSLTTNYFGLAANYGIWTAYRITPKGSIVAEFSVNADNKQAYGTYEKGLFYIKEWVMKYNRLSVAYKHDLWSSNSDKLINTKVVAQGGIYVGVMREAKLFYDGVLVFDKLADYHQFDFGLKVALGQELLIDKFVIGYGIRSDIGLTNIFKGNILLNSQENQTNIIHLGGYVLLGYRF